MRFILFFFLLTYALYAETAIENLLEAYRKASDLSEKTKAESAGNLIVYTRDDLDRMQAQTLKDIVKSLRYFHYAENRMAQPDVMNVDPILYKSAAARIFLNDHELSNALFGSGLLWFGDMELDFIDHIEIYHGFPSLKVSVEPAKLVIRLYSRSATHDEGGRFKIIAGSQLMNKQSLYYAQAFETFDYFVYASHYGDNRQELENDTLSRDRERTRLYGSIGTADHRFEFHTMHQEMDVFLGPYVLGIPTNALGEVDIFDLSWNSKFFDQSLEFLVSYSRGNIGPLSSGYETALIPGTDITNVMQKLRDTTLTLQLQKHWQIEAHDVTAGAHYRKKRFELEALRFNGEEQPITQTFDDQRIFALFLQDDYSINDSQLVTLSYMYQDTHSDDKAVNSFHTNQVRAGYIYSDFELVSKTFAAYQEFAPEPYMMSKSFHGNPHLDPMRSRAIHQEFNYTYHRTTFDLIFGYVENRDVVVVQGGSVSNGDMTSHAVPLYLGMKHAFRDDDRFDLELFRISHSKAIESAEDREIYGVTLRLLNRFERLELFNELVIREGYSTPTGYDFSSGVQYHASTDLILHVKGENIFNKGLEWQYLYDAKNMQYIQVPTIEQRFWVGMEVLF